MLSLRLVQVFALTLLAALSACGGTQSVDHLETPPIQSELLPLQGNWKSVCTPFSYSLLSFSSKYSLQVSGKVFTAVPAIYLGSDCSEKNIQGDFEITGELSVPKSVQDLSKKTHSLNIVLQDVSMTPRSDLVLSFMRYAVYEIKTKKPELGPPLEQKISNWKIGEKKTISDIENDFYKPGQTLETLFGIENNRLYFGNSVFIPGAKSTPQ
ncbi:MAG: hypothetical protein ACK5QT_03620, partial [Oligoflexia bacterium]